MKAYLHPSGYGWGGDMARYGYAAQACGSFCAFPEHLFEDLGIVPGEALCEALGALDEARGCERHLRLVRSLAACQGHELEVLPLPHQSDAELPPVPEEIRLAALEVGK